MTSARPLGQPFVVEKFMEACKLLGGLGEQARREAAARKSGEDDLQRQARTAAANVSDLKT